MMRCDDRFADRMMSSVMCVSQVSSSVSSSSLSPGPNISHSRHNTTIFCDDIPQIIFTISQVTAESLKMFNRRIACKFLSPQ